MHINWPDHKLVKKGWGLNPSVVRPLSLYLLQRNWLPILENEWIMNEQPLPGLSEK